MVWLRWLTGLIIRKQAPRLLSMARDNVMSEVRAGRMSDLIRRHQAHAHEGEADAQFMLGCAFHQGRGVAQDYVQAARWYWAAAQQGHAGAQCNLGTLYYHGAGLEQSYAEAVRWLTAAANQGSPGAMFSLANCHEAGLGLPEPDRREAIRLHRHAAERGYAPSQRSLARLLEGEHGDARTQLEVCVWYQMAAAQGDEAATQRLAHLEPMVNPHTMARAQRLAQRKARSIAKRSKSG